MNYSDFIRLLHEEMSASQEQDKRYIIHFKTKKEYLQCTAEITKQPPDGKLSSIQPIELIHAISCPIQSASKLEQYEGIKRIEEDIRIQVNAILPSKAIKQSEPSVPWGVRQIRAPQVWNQSTGSQIKIGVIDTGADFSHPDLRHCLVRGVNMLQRNMLPYDDNGHGTHISGTIAAAGGTGLFGVAPRAVIVPVKAFDYNGSAFVSDIIMGVDWCVLNKLHIVNMSFGMKQRSQSLYEAMLNAYRSGVIIVASSGNDGKSGNIDYPAKFRSTISIGATNKNRSIAPFSNRGKQVDIYAPGDKIVSTWLGGRYHQLSGTSMATSHVSGVIALMLAINPKLTPRKVKVLLKKSALPIKSTKPTTTQSACEVDAVRAVNSAK